MGSEGQYLPYTIPSDTGVGDSLSEGYDLSGYAVYGGRNGKALTGNTKITMEGGKVQSVYGGGNKAVSPAAPRSPSGRARPSQAASTAAATATAPKTATLPAQPRSPFPARSAIAVAPALSTAAVTTAARSAAPR